MIRHDGDEKVGRDKQKTQSGRNGAQGEMDAKANPVVDRFPEPP